MTSIDDVIRLLEAAKGSSSSSPKSSKSRKAPAGKKRKTSPYQKRYSAAFKKLAPKYRKKGGGWKKDGFKRCAAAARKVAKR